MVEAAQALRRQESIEILSSNTGCADVQAYLPELGDAEQSFEQFLLGDHLSSSKRGNVSDAGSIPDHRPYSSFPAINSASTDLPRSNAGNGNGSRHGTGMTWPSPISSTTLWA
jgi:hypothetical protein